MKFGLRKRSLSSCLSVAVCVSHSVIGWTGWMYIAVCTAIKDSDRRAEGHRQTGRQKEEKEEVVVERERKALAIS